MNFQFSNLLGAPYRGGKLLLTSNELLSPIGNRVSQVNLTESTSSTLPFECNTEIQTLCLAPDGHLLLAIDNDGKSILISRKRQALLHHFSFKGPVADAKFSPDGKFIAAAVGRLLQIWHTPGYAKTFAPMRLHRTIGTCHDDITALDWSPNSQFIAVACKDLTTRVFSLHHLKDFKPPVLAGHVDTPVGVFFAGPQAASAAAIAGHQPPALFTVGKDGALFTWIFQPPDSPDQSGPQQSQPTTSEAAAEHAGWGASDAAVSRPSASQSMFVEPWESVQPSTTNPDSDGQEAIAEAHPWPGAGWRFRCVNKKNFQQRGARLTTADFHKGTGILVVAFSSGLFELYQMPEAQSIQVLSVSREALTSVAFNADGDWLALGCAALGQLLVWEWRSETYVLRQQGHYYDVAVAAFSPDGAMIATGADDAKVKLWSIASGFCQVTFSEHTAPVTGLAWLPEAKAIASASMDGTVRAWDLVRYRNFRTLTTPSPVQFSCLATDPSGEMLCAGSLDTFQVFVWNIKTGRLLEALAAHEGPVTCLAFSPAGPLLATASWDHTVRTWDIFSGKGGVESLEHRHDVLAIAWRPDGKRLASSTLDGQIYIWNPHENELVGSIEGRRDIAVGRRSTDRRAAGNLSSGACFTSLAFSADGSFLLAGGSSKFVCLYDASERIMLARFQISKNRGLEGVLDVLNSRNMTEAGPVGLIDDAASDEEEVNEQRRASGPGGSSGLPGTASKLRPAIRSRAVCLSPTGRAWCAATTEGLLLYSIDQTLIFDPSEFGAEVTPAAVHLALSQREPLRALFIALRLREEELIQHALMSVPDYWIHSCATRIPPSAVPLMVTILVRAMAKSPHLQYLLQWAEELLQTQIRSIERLPASKIGPPMRSLRQVLSRQRSEIGSACTSNLYLLQYLSQAGPSTGEDPQGKLAPAAKDDVAAEMNGVSVEREEHSALESKKVALKRGLVAHDSLVDGTTRTMSNTGPLKVRRTGLLA